VAWLLTHLPEPPWGQILQNKPRTDLMRPFAKLSDPTWVAAAIAYQKDVASLNELRKKTHNDKDFKDNKDNKEK
jgi:hypothetical protein